MKSKCTGTELASLAAKLLAMNDEDFYNWLMGGTNATGKKRLTQLRNILAQMKKAEPR